MTKLFQVEERRLDEIKISNRARQDVGELNDLVQSIKDSGQLNPILITQDNELIAGERRILALKELGEEKGIVRVMPDISADDRLIIERMENIARKDFDWHEELSLRYELHKLWKAQAEKENKSWGYRETAKQLKCSIGGLSSDLALAEALDTFPELKEHTSKGRARDAYKRLGNQAVAIQRMESLSDEEKTRLEKLQLGVPQTGKNHTIPKAKHDDTIPDWADPEHDYDEENEEDSQGESETEKLQTNVVYSVENYKEFLKKVPDNVVGMVELDPPYAIDFNNVYGKTGKIESKATDWTVDQLYEFYTKYLSVIWQKLLDNSWVLIWTGREHAEWTNEVAFNIGFHIQHPGVWRKTGGSTNQPKTNMISNYETFLLLRKGNASFNTESFHACQECPSVPPQQRIHQWEKPLALYDKFLDACGRPGTIFLSLFAGSGNSMISAAKANMLPMGCDSQQKYIAQFYQKLRNHVKI